MKMRNQNRAFICAAAAAAVAAMTGANLSAAEVYWKGGVGNLTDPNYTSDGSDTIPYTPGDIVNLGANGSVTVSTAINYSAVTPNAPGSVHVGHNFGTLPGPATLTVAGSGSSLVLVGNPTATNLFDRAGLVVGYNADGSYVNVTNSNMDGLVIIGGDNPDDAVMGTGTGTLTVNGGNFRVRKSDFIIGYGNRGVLNHGAGHLMVGMHNQASVSDGAYDMYVGYTTASEWNKTFRGRHFIGNSLFIGSGSLVNLAAGLTGTKHKSMDNGYTTDAPEGDVVVGRNGSVNDRLNISYNGTPTSGLDVGPTELRVGNRFLLASGGGGATTSTVNQSDGTVNVARNLSVSDTGYTSTATYNLSGGALTANSDLSRIGRRGSGTMLQTGGTATFNAGLAIGDDDSTAPGETDNATGLYEISAGTLTTNLVGGDALRVGSAGNGTLRVVGDDGIVDVNGDFLLGNTSDGVGKLDYRFEAGESLSQIDVSGTATLAAGTGLTLDSSSAAPTQSVYNLLTAPDVADNGLIVPMLGWTHQVVAGGSGEILQAVQTTARYWDTDGATPGSGGASPSGNWDGATANFTTDAAGASAATSAATTLTDDVIFAAGGDGTGTYTVNVSGTQTAHAVQFARGDATLTGGTLAVGVFDVVPGASGTVASAVSGGGAAGSVTKIGAGTLTLTANNTYTGGTNVQAGTLRVKRLHENNAVNITGGKLQVMDSSPTLPAHPAGDNASVSRPSSLAIANNGAPLGSRTYNGQLDLGNNDLILDYDGVSNLAEIEDMVRAGYNGGDWLGNGITSSTANANRNFAIGVADNALLTIPYSAARPFSGQEVDATTILVKFTHRIDLDLDGVITTNDATIFNSNYTEGSPAYWSIGDLDYDRVFTSNDATLFNSFYSEALASVPEPTTLGVLALGGLGLLGRRRRHSC